jgi:hypothetical protein
VSGNADGIPKGLGNISPHSRQVSPRTGLESEHVLPRKWLSNTAESVGLSPISERQYGQMTTILIHKGAADIKTEGDEGDNTKLRNILTGKDGVGNPGPAVVTRVDLTMRAIKDDHTTNKRPGEPLPTRGAVSQAAAIQMGEVVRFVRENSQAAGGTADDYKKSAALVAAAEALIAGAPSNPKFVSKAGRLSGRMTAWLTLNSAEAPPATRVLVSTTQAKLLAERDKYPAPAAAAPTP